mgnify:CR=1 FL=1
MFGGYGGGDSSDIATTLENDRTQSFKQFTWSWIKKHCNTEVKSVSIELLQVP